jgi:hypothetical protein
MEPIVNKVAKSGLVTIDLQQFEPEHEIVPFDLKEYLYMEMILKEKDYRDALQTFDWDTFKEKIIAAYCSADAIIAHWAYMLIPAHSNAIAKAVYFGTPAQVREKLMLNAIDSHNWEQYRDRKVLLKGCSDKELPPSVYLNATQKLIPVADRLMYGEACSFVPVYRKSKRSGFRE